jgi:cytochrome d ubiquinol oxidase subunit I
MEMFAVDTLMAARYQMALSLGFHIVLSCFGVAFPFLIYLMHRRGLKQNDADALTLARRWSKVAAVLFAVGAVSGTILSFEMGLLWPGLMSTYGDVIGLPFALEGIAFFLEAVFLGIYLYGWDRLPPSVHLKTLIPIMVSGAFGTFCIMAVNAWMNAPTGFTLENGQVTDVDPLAAMFNSAVWGMALHMFVAAYMVVGFIVAGVYAFAIRKGRDDRRHRMGLRYALAIAGVAAVVQPVVGHFSGLRLADEQPSKLAAMELATETETRAPLRIGGVLIDGEVVGAIEIPVLGSILAGNSPNAEIPGLDQLTPETTPPVNIVHLSFQTMIGIGTLLAAFSVWFWWRERRQRSLIDSPRTLGFVSISGVLAVVALQTGWITTEVGRQPWIAYEVMTVDEAVTTNSNVWITLTATIVVYTAMGIAAFAVIRSMSSRWRRGEADALPSPYSPDMVVR